MGGTSFDTFDAGKMKTGACLYDMVYISAQTPLMAAASARGAKCVNGLGMLAGQGEAAFTWWTGIEPVKGVMRQALLTQL
jgi:shikimate dehydrogenase